MTNVIHFDSRPYQWLQNIYATNIPAPAKLIASILSTYMNNTKNYAYPSFRTLAKQASLSTTTCQKYITQLKKLGFIKVEKRIKNDQTLGNFYNFYKISYPQGVSRSDTGVSPGDTPNVGGVSPDGGGCVISEVEVCQEVTQNYQLNNQVNNQYKTIVQTGQEQAEFKLENDLTDLQNETINLQFAKLWESYPKKTGKAEARKAFFKLKPNELLFNKILKHVEDSRRIRWDHIDKNFIPGLGPYLNQKYYNEEIIPPYKKREYQKPLSAVERVMKKNAELEAMERARNEKEINPIENVLALDFCNAY